MRTPIEREGGGVRVVPVAGQLFLREKAPAYIAAASAQSGMKVVLGDSSRLRALLARNLDVKATAAAAALYMKC
jgi:hypothetical protein